MNRTKTLMMSLIAAAVLGLGATAQAQDTPPPTEPPPSSPPPARHSSSSGDGAGIGVGAAFTLSGVTTAQFVYDQAIWHLEGLFAFSSTSTMGGGDRGTGVSFGAGGWYHFHRGASSDFSLGGALIVDTFSQGGGSATVTAFEPGAQARAFITPNVALHARVGLAFLFGDTQGGGTNIFLNGQSTGSFGFTYFFR
jgi:hypothetical protein